MTRTFSTLLSIFTAAVLAAPLHASDADTAWKKVEDAINGLKKPAERPKSREESIAMFKKGIVAFDEAFAEFLKIAPTDPRRWEARLFEAQTSGTRPIVGLPPGTTDLKKVSAEIRDAADATPGIKGEISALDVLAGARAAEAGGDIKAWVASAEEHLKAYPEASSNRTITTKIKSITTTAELREKPLDLKFTAVDGREVDLASLRGKVVLIDFWATWCGPCVAELPNVLKTYREFHPKGFEIVGISLDSDKAKLESFVKDKGMDWPQFFDGKGWKNEISTRYGINSIPAMWLVDKKGMLVSTSARSTLEELVAKHLAEEVALAPSPAP